MRFARCWCVGTTLSLSSSGRPTRPPAVLRTSAPTMTSCGTAVDMGTRWALSGRCCALEHPPTAHICLQPSSTPPSPVPPIVILRGAAFQEPQPEVYGYYGRTASPPPSSTTAGSGAWASTPAPQYSIENEQEGDEAAPGGGGGGGGGEGGGAQAKGPSETGAEVFVPDFGVPEGVAVPATFRQHMMMVGTARTAVRSPQVQYTP